jgi:DNA-binding winged helix-turn-helix (wHTH) protein
LEVRDVYYFGSFKLSEHERILFCQNRPVALKSKDFDVLLVLLKNRSKLVTKTQLLDEVWPNSFVSEANLGVHIACLRKALRETLTDHSYIQTVHKHGYKFVDIENPLEQAESAFSSNELKEERVANVRFLHNQVRELLTVGADAPEAVLALGSGLRIEARRRAFGTEVTVAIGEDRSAGSNEISGCSMNAKTNGVVVRMFEQDGVFNIKIAVDSCHDRT